MQSLRAARLLAKPLTNLTTLALDLLYALNLFVWLNVAMLDLWVEPLNFWGMALNTGVLGLHTPIHTTSHNFLELTL